MALTPGFWAAIESGHPPVGGPLGGSWIITADVIRRELDATRARLAAREAENADLRAALYPLVIGCLTADANEDAPEFQNDEAYVGRRALPECGRCCGSGSTDGTEYVDVAIPEALRCPDCGGWGFLARPSGDYAALRAMLTKAVDEAYRQGSKDTADNFPGTSEGEIAAIVARLLPATQAQGEKEGAEG